MFTKGRKCHKKFWLPQICLVMVLVMALSGCGLIGNGVQKGQAGDLDENAAKIGLITGERGIDDPYYQKAWDGLQKAEQDLKVGIGYIKAKNVKDYPAKLAELKNEGYELIFTIGSQAVPAVLEAAAKNPEIKYICLDSTVAEPVPANVLGVSYKVEEGAFLAGYLAGKITDSNVVGFISGDNHDESLRYFYGYKAGLRFVSSQCELMKGIAGTFTNKGRLKEMAERMVECKADVIFHVAGTAGQGVTEVMAKADGYSIGSDVDQNKLAPESVLSSVIKNNDTVSLQLINQFKAKSLLLGRNVALGLADKGVSLAELTENMVPEDINKRLLALQEEIIEGKRKVPSTEKEYFEMD
jgi:basic membrane protein A